MKQFGHGKGTVYGGCSEYTIVPAKYAYLLKTDIEDTKAAILERNLVLALFSGPTQLLSTYLWEKREGLVSCALRTG